MNTAAIADYLASPPTHLEHEAEFERPSSQLIKFQMSVSAPIGIYPEIGFQVLSFSRCRTIYTALPRSHEPYKDTTLWVSVIENSH